MEQKWNDRRELAATVIGRVIFVLGALFAVAFCGGLILAALELLSYHF